LVRAAEANTGELVLNYIEGTLRQWQQNQWVAQGLGARLPGVQWEPRIWFNPEADYLAAMLPGSIAVIMTLIGTMLTSLVVAREWERGTMESLLSMGLSRAELFLGKFFPYFLLGMLAMELISVVGVVFLGVPFRGSWWVLHLVTAVYLGYALGLGLTVSSLTRSQFLATQAALIIGFLPSFLLSGLVFEIQSMPAAIRMLTCVFPPRYLSRCSGRCFWPEMFGTWCCRIRPFCFCLRECFWDGPCGPQGPTWHEHGLWGNENVTL
jgi:ABC-type multidrug transport system, permease component